MKILFVTPFLPSPPRFGAERRLDGLARELARRHEVSMLWFNAERAPLPDSFEITRGYCRSLHTTNAVEARPNARRHLQLRSLFSRHSFEHWQALRQPDFQRILGQLLEEVRYDVVQFESTQVAAFAQGVRSAAPPVFVLDEHNIEYDVLRRTTDASRCSPRGLYQALNWRKLACEERAAWRRFDGVTLTSARDQQLLTGVFRDARTAVIPNGVALAEFPKATTRAEPYSLLFFGALNYFPNRDGVSYFIDHIFPEIRKLQPRAKFVVVGPGAPESLHRKLCPGVEIVGRVADVGPYLDRATAVVVPLRIGGGTRLKIVEAMAKGRPVVSTTLGAEGLAVAHGRQLLLADEPADFARQVERVFTEPELAQELGNAGRRLVEERYDWRHIALDLEQFYEELRMARS